MPKGKVKKNMAREVKEQKAAEAREKGKDATPTMGFAAQLFAQAGGCVHAFLDPLLGEPHLAELLIRLAGNGEDLKNLLTEQLIETAKGDIEADELGAEYKRACPETAKATTEAVNHILEYLIKEKSFRQAETMLVIATCAEIISVYGLQTLLKMAAQQSAQNIMSVVHNLFHKGDQTNADSSEATLTDDDRRAIERAGLKGPFTVGKPAKA